MKRTRKISNESFVRSKKPSEVDEPPSKKLRQDDSFIKTRKATGHSTTVGSAKRQATKLVKTNLVDQIFPRGGASLLTPLEHKQIHIEATRDVLFEQQSTSRKQLAQEEEPSRTRTSGATARSRKSKSNGVPMIGRPDVEDESVKIEGLSYQRLVPGSLVLGQVSEISSHDIALALPNNLTGYVPLTNVSDTLTQTLEKIADLDMNNDADSSKDEESIEPKDLFHMGQYLRAFVVSTNDESAGKTGEKRKRHIELSLRPQESNYGLTRRELVPNSMIMASVMSVEDHGLIMDLGLLESGIHGFISSKEVGHITKLSTPAAGTVVLCMITGLSSNGKIVKLSADTNKFANSKKLNYLVDGPTVDSFLPGTMVELLISDITQKGIVGKLMGMVNVTADVIHSGAGTGGKDLSKIYKIGTKTKGRIICTFPAAEPLKLGISLLDHVMCLVPRQTLLQGQLQSPLGIIPISSIIEKVTVTKVEEGVGLFVDFGLRDIQGFVHISRIADGKIDSISESSGPYRLDSVHRGRVIGFSSMDGIFILSLEQRTLDQPFLRLEDVVVGEVVKGKVEKLIINSSGIGGVLVAIADGISGLVPSMHLADVPLVHPEKKFKEGANVTARVLSTDPVRRQIRLTLKKTLVNSEASLIKSYTDVTPGMQSPGTIVNVIPSGAVVQFYGNVRGFLPVSEMSESYIQDPAQHFRVGQVVNVHVLKVDVNSEKLTVSCKDPSTFGIEQQKALKTLKIGEILPAKVVEKSSDDIVVELEQSGLRAILSLGHLTDGSESKNVSALKKIRIGQTLQNLSVLDKSEERKLVFLTSKPSLVGAAKNRTLLRNFEDVRVGCVVQGFVRSVTTTAVYVQFGGGLIGLVPKSRIPDEFLGLPNFGLTRSQSISTKVQSVDLNHRKFLLSIKDPKHTIVGDAGEGTSLIHDQHNQQASNPIDETIKSVFDLTLGRLTTARIASIKDTQINVLLADNIRGRIDVSQVFDLWDDIKDRKYPLRTFTAKQNIPVRVIGVHDARNHRFLPITHRTGKTPVFELSAKPSDQQESDKEVLSLDQVKVGSSWIAFVNNTGDDCLWVNLSPNVRGRIPTLEISEDVGILGDLEKNFPIGSAIKVYATGVDVANNRLDLSARSVLLTQSLSMQSLSKNMILPGKVTRVNERQLMVQLSDKISGPVHLTDLADDFSLANPAQYSKKDIIRVCIIDVDKKSQRIRLSTRPSRVLNSSLPVKDREISSVSQLKANDVVRGFIKNVTDNGVFVNLGGNVSAYVRVSDLSDSYIKDWKASFLIDQLVEGKVIITDPSLNHVQLSLKASVIDKDYIPPITFNDLKSGQVVTGRIRKVEDFGVFIVIDGSANVSGLCHRSEIADGKVDNVKKLYEHGDIVKAKVLKLDHEKRRVSFGLKSSYFDNDPEHDADGNSGDSDIPDGSSSEAGMSDDEGDGADGADGGVQLLDIASVGSDPVRRQPHGTNPSPQAYPEPDSAALRTSGFDWTAGILDDVFDMPNEDSSVDGARDQPRKIRRKPTITVDKTGELDANGPQSVSDFERLLIGQSDSSRLWIEYMAFHMRLSELVRARDVAERAIQTINIHEETEKMNVWIALLNLENVYGSAETLEETFNRACQYNDPQEIHERLTSIYIRSGKNGKADELFQSLLKKFSQSPNTWYNYAHFLHHTMSSPDRARLLLPRAIQSLPSNAHLSLTVKFAALEFNSANGSAERGRTILEGLLSTFPKRLDIWNQLLDLEIHQGDQEIIRALFERVLKVRGLKPRAAKAWFKRWSEWEGNYGDSKSQEMVHAKVREWVRGTAVTNE